MFFVLSGFIITTMLWRAPAPATLGRRLVGRSSGDGWSGSTRRCSGSWSVAVVLYAVAPAAPLDPVEVARRGVLVLGQVVGRLGGRPERAASGCRPCTRSGRPGRWPSSGTSTCSGRWSCSAARRAGSAARRLADREPGRGRTALPRLAAAERLLVLLRPVRTVRRAARRRRAGAVVPGRRRPDASLARTARPASVARAGWRSAPSLPVRARRRTARSTATSGSRSPCWRPSVLIYTGYSNPGGPVHRLLSHPWLATVGRLQLQPLPVAHRADAAAARRLTCGLPKPVLGLIAVAGTVVLTVLSYRFLERPFLRPRSDVLAASDRASTAVRGRSRTPDRRVVAARPARLRPGSRRVTPPCCSGRCGAELERSSAEVRVGLRPIRVAAAARRRAPCRPSASRSARNVARTGRSGPTSSPGSPVEDVGGHQRRGCRCRGRGPGRPSAGRAAGSRPTRSSSR